MSVRSNHISLRTHIHHGRLACLPRECILSTEPLATVLTTEFSNSMMNLLSTHTNYMSPKVSLSSEWPIAELAVVRLSEAWVMPLHMFATVRASGEPETADGTFKAICR